MKEQLFDDLLVSVKEAGQILRGRVPPTRVFTVKALDVRRLRHNLKLSQAEFAALVHVSVP